jgi:hypothetical protein
VGCGGADDRVRAGDQGAGAAMSGTLLLNKVE